MSPFFSVRSPVLWCGFALFRPEDTTVTTWLWPCSWSRRARSAATSDSRRPVNRTARISSYTASAAAAADARRATSWSSFTARSSGSTTLRGR